MLNSTLSICYVASRFAILFSAIFLLKCASTFGFRNPIPIHTAKMLPWLLEDLLPETEPALQLLFSSSSQHSDNSTNKYINLSSNW